MDSEHTQFNNQFSYGRGRGGSSGFGRGGSFGRGRGGFSGFGRGGSSGLGRGEGISPEGDERTPPLPPDFDTKEHSPATMKKPSFKLRKSITPKSAFQFLQEGPSGKSLRFDYYDIPYTEKERRARRRNVPVEKVGDYDCLCLVENERYFGDGFNKNDSKNAAAESAIQAEIKRKCELNETQSLAPNEDNCPWSMLASIALHRMYESWQSQGYQVPKELITPNAEESPAELSNVVGGEKNNKSALQLFNELVSRCEFDSSFELVNESGSSHDKLFEFEVRIGDQQQHAYTGRGKNKKVAKNAAAAAALQEKEVWYKPRVKEVDVDES